MGQHGRCQEVVVVACDNWGHMKCCPHGLRLVHDSGAIKKKILGMQAKHEHTLCVVTSIQNPQRCPHGRKVKIRDSTDHLRL